MMGHEMEKTEQLFRILQSGGLAQVNQTIDHGEISIGDSRTQGLKVPGKRRPCGWDLLQQLHCGAMNRASVTEVDPHPVGGSEFVSLVDSNPAFGRFLLRLPGQQVIVATMTK